MDRTTELISTYAAALSYADLTPGAIHSVKRSLIDSLGCALGASRAEPVKIVRRLASRVRSTMPATLLGTTIRTTPEMAAFVNGIIRDHEYRLSDGDRVAIFPPIAGG